MTINPLSTALIGLAIWLLVANIEILFLHVRYRGSMKRGIKILSGNLPANVGRFLRNLQSDIHDGDSGAFIRKQNNLVLVQPFHTRPWWYHWVSQWRQGGFLPYVALIDLKPRQLRIQYRAPIFSLPLILVWLAVISLVKFHPAITVLIVVTGLLMFIGNHMRQKSSIMAFIKKTMASDGS
ncbi:MAG: hypothetical protein JXA42_03455 [Anaerolineales bacterium]|nr:hypothetical protein [Anaerolineales bacterium]